VVAFLKKSSAKNFSMEKFLWVDVDGANMGAFILGRMTRPVFAEGKNRSAWGVSLWGPFFFGQN